MRIKFISLSVVWLFCNLILAQCDEHNIVAYYPLDGDAIDYSKFENHGIIYGSVVPAKDRNNEPNKALFFDGQTGYIETVDNLNLDTDNTFSISLWVRPKSLPERERIAFISTWKYNINFNEGFFLGIRLAKELSWRVNSSDYNYGESMKDNEWSHIVVTSDSTEYCMYYNSVLIFRYDEGERIIKHDSPLQLALLNFEENKSSYFNGHLDDLIIFDKILSQDDVIELYEGCITTTFENDFTLRPLIYPNPFNDVLHLKNTGGKQFYIINQSGTIVFDSKYENQTTISEINTKYFDAGIYFVRFRSEDSDIILKVVKN